MEPKAPTPDEMAQAHERYRQALLEYESTSQSLDAALRAKESAESTYLKASEDERLSGRALVDTRRAYELAMVAVARDARCVEIIVNGSRLTVGGTHLTYDEVVELAGSSGNPTVVYSSAKKGDTRRSGEMHRGCADVAMEAGMVFTVMHTGNA